MTDARALRLATTPAPAARTVGEALENAARQWGARPALLDGVASDSARAWSYAELHRDAQRVARALLARFEVGDRICVWSPNCPEWVLLELGAALAGMVLVTANPAYNSRELEHVLRQSRARGIVVRPEHRGRDLLGVVDALQPALPHLERVVSFDDWPDLTESGDVRVDLPAVHPADPAQIQYTSGTTGTPKGALLSHRGLTANASLFASAIGAVAGDVWVNPMPLFHTAGCGLVTLGALQSGGAHVLPGGFDAELVLDLIEHHGGTTLLCVPTMLIRLLQAQEASARDVASWRVAAVGGAPVPPELVHRTQDQLDVSVAIGFGQTEASPYITHTTVDDSRPAWYDTVGPPLPGIDVKICDPDTGATVGLGETGELCTRSGCVMIGYFDDPAATGQAIDGEGWLHTGDLAAMGADGYVVVRGRIRDLIIRGGENVYPREVEDLLFTHPDVGSVAVVGLPDSEWGEVVAAFVVPREPAVVLDADELDRFCRERLAAYKVPRVWHVVDALPHTASGKVQKFALREQYS